MKVKFKVECSVDQVNQPMLPSAVRRYKNNNFRICELAAYASRWGHKKVKLSALIS